MGSSITSQNSHALTAIVGTDETVRDRVGHLVRDPNTDREFRFCKFRGSVQGSRGALVFAYKLATDGTNPYNITARAGTDIVINRDFVGVIVGQSTITSGMHCYVMTKGQLGKMGESLYLDTIYARTNKGVAEGEKCLVSTLTGVSTAGLDGNENSDYRSGDVYLTNHNHVCALAMEADTGSNLTEGLIQSPLLHGYPMYGP